MSTSILICIIVASIALGIVIGLILSGDME